MITRELHDHAYDVQFLFPYNALSNLSMNDYVCTRVVHTRMCVERRRMCVTASIGMPRYACECRMHNILAIFVVFQQALDKRGIDI